MGLEIRSFVQARWEPKRDLGTRPRYVFGSIQDSDQTGKRRGDLEPDMRNPALWCLLEGRPKRCEIAGRGGMRHPIIREAEAGVPLSLRPA